MARGKPTKVTVTMDAYVVPPEERGEEHRDFYTIRVPQWAGAVVQVEADGGSGATAVHRMVGFGPMTREPEGEEPKLIGLALMMVPEGDDRLPLVVRNMDAARAAAEEEDGSGQGD